PLRASRRKPATRRTRRARRGRRLTAVAIFARYAANAGVVVLMAGAALSILLIALARDLPSTDGLWSTERGPRVALLAIDGAPLAVQGASAGAPVRLADLPAHVPNAVLAVEDRNFRHHFGVNPVAVARAL